MSQSRVTATSYECCCCAARHVLWCGTTHAGMALGLHGCRWVCNPARKLSACITSQCTPGPCVHKNSAQVPERACMFIGLVCGSLVVVWLVSSSLHMYTQTCCMVTGHATCVSISFAALSLDCTGSWTWPVICRSRLSGVKVNVCVRTYIYIYYGCMPIPSIHPFRLAKSLLK